MTTYYEVQTYTILDGWINTWFDDGTATDFITARQAQAAIDKFFNDLEAAGMASDYTRDDYRIVYKDTGEPLQYGEMDN